MFRGGSYWKPPVMNPYTQGMPDDLVEGGTEIPVVPKVEEEVVPQQKKGKLTDRYHFFGELVHSSAFLYGDQFLKERICFYFFPLRTDPILEGLPYFFGYKMAFFTPKTIPKV